MRYRTKQLENDRYIVERSANGEYWGQLGWSHSTEQEAQDAIEIDSAWESVVEADGGNQ